MLPLLVIQLSSTAQAALPIPSEHHRLRVGPRLNVLVIPPRDNVMIIGP